MTNPIYSFRNLTHSYGKHQTLSIDVLEILKGTVVGLVGPNGSGKSTLLKILAFLLPRNGGTLFFEGLNSDGRHALLRREVTLLLQEPYLLRRSVRENIAYGLKLRGVPAANIDVLAADMLARVGLAANFAERPWYRLSGGEAQRVALAVRLALRPKVLLLDEPTANVDEASAALIKGAIWHAWNDWKTTIVIATHDLAWLYEVTAKVVGLYRGRVIGDGAENIIQGGWHIEGGLARLNLRNQVILAFPPVNGSQLESAMINPSNVNIEPMLSNEAETGSKANRLEGLLTQMLVERATGDILAVVDCDGLFLRSRFSLNTARAKRLFPGMRVRVFFEASSVQFL